MTRKKLVLLFILVLASFFRLYKIDGYMEFLGDQGRDVVIVWKFLTQGDLMFIGPQTSIGNMYLGPWFYYFIAPALFVSNYSPVGPSILVALCGILTTYLIYKISSKWFGEYAGIVSSLVFAVSPVVIKFTSFSWNPNIMPLFSLLFVYSLTQKRYVVAALSFIMVLNSHYLGLLLLAPALFIIYHNKPNLSDLLKPILVIFFGFLPLILFDFKHNNQNINSILKFFTVRQETVNLKPYKAIPEFYPLFNQISTRILVGKNEEVGKVFTVIFFASLIFLSLKERKDKNYQYIFLWFTSGILGLALYKQHIYDHYFAFLFPAICIIFGILVSRLRYLGYFLLLVCLYLSLSNSHLKYQPNNQLSTVKTIVKKIIADSSGADFNISLLAKQNYDPPYKYFAYLNNSKLQEISNKKTGILYIICEPFQQDCSSVPKNHPEYSIAAFGQAKLVNTEKVDNITIFKLVPDKI